MEELRDASEMEAEVVVEVVEVGEVEQTDQVLVQDLIQGHDISQCSELTKVVLCFDSGKRRAHLQRRDH